MVIRVPYVHKVRLAERSVDCRTSIFFTAVTWERLNAFPVMCGPANAPVVVYGHVDTLLYVTLNPIVVNPIMLEVPCMVRIEIAIDDIADTVCTLATVANRRSGDVCVRITGSASECKTPNESTSVRALRNLNVIVSFKCPVPPPCPGVVPHGPIDQIERIDHVMQQSSNWDMPYGWALLMTPV